MAVATPMSVPPRFLDASRTLALVTKTGHTAHAAAKLNLRQCIALPCSSCLLAFGAVASMGSKGMLNAKGVGLDGKEKAYAKPWFINVFMYMGMSLTLPLHYMTVANEVAEEGQTSEVAAASFWGSLMPSAYILGCSALLAALNCLGLALARTGLQYVSTSLWEMMRGSRVVFNAAFATLLLGSTLTGSQWAGIKVSCTGVVIVGIAALMKAQWASTQSAPSVGAPENYGAVSKMKKTDDNFETQVAANHRAGSKEIHPSQAMMRVRPVLTGVAFTILGSCLNALEYTMQDHLLHAEHAPEKLMLGLQGCWGLLYMVIIICPLMSKIPGTDNGCKEDAADALEMVRSSRSIQNWIMFFMLGDVCANLAGVEVTALASAVTRSEVDVLRPLLLMILGLVMYYFVDRHSPFAESWSQWDILRLIGFAFVMLGVLMYGGVVDAQDVNFF